MKYLFLLLFSVAANSAPIDQTVFLLNKELNPKALNQIGYDVEYREDNGYGWMNIVKAEYKCKARTRAYLISGIIVRITDNNNCGLTSTLTNMSGLYQISCESKGSKDCKKLLAQRVTSKVIQEMIKLNVHDLYVK